MNAGVVPEGRVRGRQADNLVIREKILASAILFLLVVLRF